MDWAKLPWKSSEYAAIALINEQNHLAQQKRANYFLQRRLQAFLFAPNRNGHFLVRHSTNTLLPRMSGWRCCLPMMTKSITSAGRFSPLGSRGHLLLAVDPEAKRTPETNRIHFPALFCKARD